MPGLRLRGASDAPVPADVRGASRTNRGTRTRDVSLSHVCPRPPPRRATRNQTASGHTPEPVPHHEHPCHPRGSRKPNGARNTDARRTSFGHVSHGEDFLRQLRPFPAFITEPQSPTRGVPARQSHHPVLLKRRPKRANALRLTLKPFPFVQPNLSVPNTSQRHRRSRPRRESSHLT